MNKSVLTYRFLIVLFLGLINSNLYAFFDSVEIGINGLTCSQCTRSVELSIRKLSFVDNVEMNLEHSEGKITFKPNAKVSIEEIADAVMKAGFSVRYLRALFVFQNKNVNNNDCLLFEEQNYQFVKIEPKKLDGKTTLKFVGKKYLPTKEYKEWKPLLNNKCGNTKEPILYVTL
ncbi:MAG: heavy metal-associated domain-containing protein [Bacteroidia bacterium]